MYEGYLSVSLGDDVFCKLVKSLYIVREYRAVVIKGIINGNGRYLACYQFLHHFGVIIHICYQDSVKPSVSGMFQICRPLPPNIPAQEKDIVALAFGFVFRGVQYLRKKFVCQADVCLILEKDSERVRKIGLELPGRHIRHVMKLFRGDPDLLGCGGAHISVTVQSLADGRGGYSAPVCNVSYRYHPVTLCS